MKVTGVVAEYNPFHNGHRYHLEQARLLTGADYCVAAISGDFVQRGEPAIYDKYVRTQMALLCGADLVLELPSVFACSSAEDFASCAVALFDQLGGVDFLCFGSEEGELSSIRTAAAWLSEESDAFSGLLAQGMKQGLSWPKARSRAMALLAEKEALPLSAGLLERLLSSPNNLLGIEYCKALIRQGSRITPVTLARRGAGYHQEGWETEYASASALRRLLLSGSLPEDGSGAAAHIPAVLLPLCRQAHPLAAEDLSELLNYRILDELQQGRELCRFADLSPELAARLRRQALQYGGWQQRILQLKTRQYTYTRISRALLHLVLGITQEQITQAKNAGFAPYARILGFRREAAPLLTHLKAHSSIPLIPKVADARRRLSGTALSLFQQDLFASHLRQSLEASRFRTAPVNEYSRPLCII